MTTRVLASAAMIALALSVAPAARAQAADARGPLADAWIEHVLERQSDDDTLLRYLVAPSNAILGGLFLTTPAWSDLSLGADAALVAAGALMGTAAVGTWATPDPHDAMRWNGALGSLGFVALGAASIAACAGGDNDCTQHRITRDLGLGFGAIEAGLFTTTFLLWTLLPPPSPRAYGLTASDGSGEQRHARVLAFLKERHRRRRIGAYATLPFGLAMGGSFLVFAHEAETSGGRTLMYGAGGVLLAFVAGATLYELLRTPDFERFEAGERPDD